VRSVRGAHVRVEGRTMESKVLRRLSPACPRKEGTGTQPQPRSCFNGNDTRRVGREPAFVFPRRASQS
jgi:hypothetical protein